MSKRDEGVSVGKSAALLAIALLLAVPIRADEASSIWAVEAGYKGEGFTLLSGPKQGQGGYLSNVDLRLRLDLGSVWDSAGPVVEVALLGNAGADPTAQVEDIQATSNIETGEDALKLYEAWLRQAWDGSVFVQVGLHDLNSEFYVTDSSGLLLNSSFGVGAEFAQTSNGPSIFPTTALAALAGFGGEKSWYGLAGIYDAVAGDPANPARNAVILNSDEGFLSVAEAGYRGGEGFRVGLGGWSYSVKEPEAYSTVAPTERTNRGVYGLAETSWGDKSSGFLRLGWAEDRINECAANLSLGIVSQGPGWASDGNEWSVGVTAAFAGGPFRRMARKAGASLVDAETTLEATWRLPLVKESLALQPDVQLVFHPGYDADALPVWIASLRFEVVWAR